ncbi:MAG: response regulator [Elusimicrobia bacterium]|nr:response regulator [Elusimicrobiota bacterium]
MEHKILIADDDSTVLRLLCRLFKRPEYETLSASSGRQALELAVSGRPDLVLLDVNMPDASGRDVLRDLRSHQQTRMIPVILVTGNNATSDKVEGLSLGADDYVTKPFSLDELKARVEGLLRRKKLDICANPLTGLPGSPAVEEEVNRRLREDLGFAFFHIDIDNFKAFNDVYGFARGDEVIRKTAEFLVDALAQEGSSEDFAGHIGGDDFVAVTDAEKAADVALALVQAFDLKAPFFYDDEHRRRGYISAVSRAGKVARFPIMTLSLGISSNAQRPMRHYAEVAQTASEMKAYLKAQPNKGLSRFAFDRRRS